MLPITRNRFANMGIDRVLDDLLRSSTLTGFAGFGLGTPPASGLDVREDDKTIHIDMDMPGISKDDVKVTLEDGILTISAEKSKEVREEREDANRYIVRGRRSAKSFSRSLRFPDGMDSDSVTATLKNGVLTVSIGKAEGARRRNVDVRGE